MYTTPNHVTHTPEFVYKKLNAEKLDDLSMSTQLIGNLQNLLVP